MHDKVASLKSLCYQIRAWGRKAGWLISFVRSLLERLCQPERGVKGDRNELEGISPAELDSTMRRVAIASHCDAFKCPD